MMKRKTSEEIRGLGRCLGFAIESFLQDISVIGDLKLSSAEEDSAFVTEAIYSSHLRLEVKTVISFLKYMEKLKI